MTTPEERDAIEYEEYTDPNAEILALTASRDSLIARNDDLAEALGEARATQTSVRAAALREVEEAMETWHELYGEGYDGLAPATLWMNLCQIERLVKTLPSA